MDKIKNRIIVGLFSFLVLGGSYLGVLATEQKKRFATRNATQAEIQASLTDAERLRQEYFTAVEAKKAELSAIMAEMKSQYDELLQKQPSLIDANKRGVSIPVTKTVTTQVPTTAVTTSKPQSTRKTKTS